MLDNEDINTFRLGQSESSLSQRTNDQRLEYHVTCILVGGCPAAMLSRARLVDPDKDFVAVDREDVQQP